MPKYCASRPTIPHNACTLSLPLESLQRNTDIASFLAALSRAAYGDRAVAGRLVLLLRQRLQLWNQWQSYAMKQKCGSLDKTSRRLQVRSRISCK